MKNGKTREEKLVNNAIQYMRGFSDALEYIEMKHGLCLDIKVQESKNLIEDYRDRLQDIKKREVVQTGKKVRKNARRNK